MEIRCGLIGMPNVGKSTLFNALTAMEVAAQNYPFCTLDPNVGVVGVPDSNLERIAEVARPASTVPATVEFVDVAGLVRGASRGEGLGNRFLAHVRQADAIIHVVRCFAGTRITHVSGKVDPLDDMQTIDTELLLADLETATRALQKAQRQARTNEADALAWHDLVKGVTDRLAAGHAARDMALSREESAGLDGLGLITAKPVMYVANVAESGLGDPVDSEPVRARAATENAPVVVVCAAFEAALAQLPEEDRGPFLEEMGLISVCQY